MNKFSPEVFKTSIAGSGNGASEQACGLLVATHHQEDNHCNKQRYQRYLTDEKAEKDPPRKNSASRKRFK
ncbi:hypothetical protein RJ640_012449, partial [Escallonia rubra]